MNIPVLVQIISVVDQELHPAIIALDSAGGTWWRPFLGTPDAPWERLAYPLDLEFNG